MGVVRTVGLGLAFTASVLWLLAAGVFFFRPALGAPFEIALFLVAVPISVLAAALLILTLRTTRTRTRWVAAALVAGSAALLPLIPVAAEPVGLSGEAYRGLFVLGIGAFVAATVLFALPVRTSPTQ